MDYQKKKFTILVFILSTIFFIFNLEFIRSGNDFFFRSTVYDSLTYVTEIDLRYSSLFSQGYFKSIIFALKEYIIFDIKIFSIIIDKTLGMSLYAFLFFKNHFLIFFFQYALFIYGILKLGNTIEEKKKSLFFNLILLSHLYIFASLTTVNKEILTYLSILFMINYFFYQKIIFIYLSIILAFFTRFEFFVFQIIYILIFINKKKYELISNIIFTVALLIIITVSYDKYSSFYILEKMQSENSLGISMYLHELNADHYMHFLTIFVKIFGNAFGGLIKPLNYVNLEHILNYVSQICFFVLFITLIIKNYKFQNKLLIFYLLNFLIIFSVNSFIHHRYLIPSILLFIFIFIKSYEKEY